jgi:hypothetical protein
VFDEKSVNPHLHAHTAPTAPAVGTQTNDFLESMRSNSTSTQYSPSFITMSIATAIAKAAAVAARTAAMTAAAAFTAADLIYASTSPTLSPHNTSSTPTLQAPTAPSPTFTHSPVSVGKNVSDNNTVSLDGALDGKEFLRLSKDMKVSAIAALFGTTCVPYVEFVKNKYKDDWVKQLTKRSVLSKGTDVPIWTEEMCGDSQTHQHFASLQKQPAKNKTSKGKTKASRPRARRQLAMVAHALHCVLSAAFDDGLTDALRYQGDKHCARATTTTTHTMIPTPKNHRHAHSSPHSSRWTAAERKEWDGLWEMGTFTDVARSSLPTGTKIHRMNWVYKCKEDKDKARLCFDGRHQDPNSYDECYSPTARAQSMRIILAKAANNGWEVWGDDVSQAFLYAKRPADKPLYAAYPVGHEKHGHCVLLNRFIYGLHDSPLAFHNLVRHHMLNEQKFTADTADPCVYHKFNQKSDEEAHVRVHVDDFLSTGTPSMVAEFRNALAHRFKTTGELATTHYGLDISRRNGTYKLGCRTYITRKLEAFHQLSDVKTWTTPMAQHLVLPKLEGKCPDAALQKHYRSLVGSLIFPASTCRPDIAFAAHVLSRHLEHPNEQHVAAAYRVFGYLKGTIDVGVVYGKSKSLEFYGTSDAAHLTQQATHDWPPTLGVTGYHFQLGSGSISWRAGTQKLTSHSSTESELYALDEAARELVYLNKLLTNFGIKVPKPVMIGQDNMAAITLTNSENFNPRTKHIAVRYMYINDLQREGVCKVRYLPTDNIPSDALTKALGHREHLQHTQVILGYKQLVWTNEKTQKKKARFTESET